MSALSRFENSMQKPALLLLPRTLEHSLLNRQWLDCGLYWQQQGGCTFVAAPHGPLAYDCARAGIHVTHLPFGSGAVAAWQSRRLIGALARRSPPCQIWLEDIKQWSALQHLGLKHVKINLFVHEPLPARRKTQRQLQNFLVQGGTIIVSSRYVAQQLQRDFALPETALTFLPPAIDPVAFDPAQIRPERALRLAAAWRIPENAALFLHGGAVRPDGGQISLLHALAQSGRKDVYLVILGEETVPGCQAKLMHAINHFGLGGQVRLVPSCSDLPAALWLAQAAVFANRDPAGADPLLLAAQAMGRPLVVTDSGAHHELVAPADTAWVYPATDKDALPPIVTEILALGEQARHMHALRTRQWVLEQFPYTSWRTTMLGLSAPQVAIPDNEDDWYDPALDIIDYRKTA